VAFFFTEHPVEADEYAAMSARHQLPNAVEREATSKRLMKELEQAARRRDFDLEEKLNRQLEENELKDRYDGPMGQAVMPVYLRVTNPLVVDFKGSVDLHLMTSKIDEAKASGHDGLKMLNVYDAVAERPEKFTTTQWAVFEPKQIKSATGNSGAFSDKTANILKQGANADIALGESKAVVRLFQTEDPSSFLHESGHYFLEMFARVAEREDAPAAMKADLAGVLEWAGYGDRATMVRTQQEVADLQAKIGEREPTEAERAKLIELSKPHENFARGFEQYLREGRAPAQGLRGAFAKIKEWMLAVYKAVKDLVTLTPQMRDFFDRLLASEEEIAKAKERVGDEPLFKGPDDFPGKPEEFAAYQKTVQAARDSQEQALERHLMRASLEERSDLYKAERVRVREGFDTQVGDQPEFKALSALQDGELPNGDPLPKDLQGIKLDKQVLDHDYTPEELARLPGPGKDVNRGKAVYAREGGWLPETAAAHFGFRSGDELVRALMDAPDRATLVDQLTDEHMAREHPDAMKDKALLEQLASESLATDKAGDLLEDELKHLALKVGQNAQLRQVYRVAAQSKISEQSERELAPNQYRQGEAKAAREQHAALAKGDFAGALEAGKRRLMRTVQGRQRGTGGRAGHRQEPAAV
jgi:hypothetical protein